MKTRIRPWLIALLAVALLPRAAAATAPGQPTPRFVQVRERIAALFQHRNAPPAPLDPRANPFRAGGIAVPDAAPAGAELPAEKNADSDATLLREAVASLKFNGTFEKDGQILLIINTRPYKRSDVIHARVRGRPVDLLVRDLSRRTMTLALNDAELTLKF